MGKEIEIAIISAITAIITALLSFLGNIVLNRRKTHEEELKDAKRQQFNEDRDDYFDKQIELIKNKLDEHNHYAKKFEEVNIQLVEIKKDIEYIKNR